MGLKLSSEELTCFFNKLSFYCEWSEYCIHRDLTIVFIFRSYNMYTLLKQSHSPIKSSSFILILHQSVKVLCGEEVTDKRTQSSTRLKNSTHRKLFFTVSNLYCWLSLIGNTFERLYRKWGTVSRCILVFT